MKGEPPHRWTSPQSRELVKTIVDLRSVDEAKHFLRDLCTIGELEAMTQRWHVARLLDRGLPYQEVSRRTGASTTTVTRVAHWLHHGEGGYRTALDRSREQSRTG